MRDVFVKSLIELAGKDSNVMLLTADLGFGVLTRFAEKFPRQFLNVGVAEQNMTGLATGMALEGKTVFTYSIGNFPTFRCLEQIRNDVCYHNANVKIVSIGGGFCYGPLGISHQATEDLAVMRALPNMTIVAPGDPVETALATKAIYEHKGPCYLRLGRGGEPGVHSSPPTFNIGQAISLSTEGEIAILSIGGILSNAVSAGNILKNRWLRASVYSVHTLKPIDRELIQKIRRRARLVVTVEEHVITGGLGSAVAEVLSESPEHPVPLLRLGIGDRFTSEVGSQEYLRNIYDLTPEGIASRIERRYTENI